MLAHLSASTDSGNGISLGLFLALRYSCEVQGVTGERGF